MPRLRLRAPLSADLSLVARGTATADEAWRRYVDLGRWPEWSPQIRAVQAPSSRLVPGLSGRVLPPVGPAASFVVLEVDEARRLWSWQVTAGPAGGPGGGLTTLDLEHGVDERVGGGSTATLRLQGAVPVVLGYAPLARLALRRLVAA